jgi:threonine dehydratase
MFVCPSGLFFFICLWTHLRIEGRRLWAAAKKLWMGVATLRERVTRMRSPDADLQGLPDRIEAAARRIRPYLAPTPLRRSAALSEATGANVFCKLENLTPTGSFKIRGALNKLLALDPKTRAQGVVAASTGNHGAAVAYALAKLGASGIIFVPHGASAAKIERIRGFGGDVRFAGKESGETEQLARAYADAHQMTYVSPYNDWDVVAGQGTIGIEILDELLRVDVLIASLGGGGLVGGTGAYLKSRLPQARVVAASPRNSAAMIESLKARSIVEVEHLPTLSDGTAGSVEPGAITFELCRRVIDECVLVAEDEIADQMRGFEQTEGMRVEGAAGVALAALRRIRAPGANAVILICGGNPA